jgi:UDP-2,3-diacylglucosamine pyrophosphatase LpxH
MKNFFRFIRNLSEDVDAVYVNGDIFDLWKTFWLSDKSIEEELAEIHREYPLTLDFFINSPKTKLFIGNHDDYLEKKINSPLWNNKLNKRIMLRNNSNESILIWHGHLDFFNTKLAFVGRTITFLGGWIERILAAIKAKGIYMKFRHFARSTAFKNSTQIKKFKLDIEEDDSIVCLINGHTHINEIKRFEYNGKTRLYVNTGKYDGFTKDVTIIDTETLDVVKSTVHEKNFAKVKKVLQKGDVILTRNLDNKFSQLIASASGGVYSHAMMYVGNNQVIESTIGKTDGVQISLIDKYLDGSHELAILSLKDQTKVDAVIKSFYSLLGKKYAYLQLLLDGIYLFVRKVLKKNISKKMDLSDGVVCSEAVAKALHDNGYDFEPTTSPNDFLDRTDVFDIKLITLHGTD